MARLSHAEAHLLLLLALALVSYSHLQHAHMHATRIHYNIGYSHFVDKFVNRD